MEEKKESLDLWEYIEDKEHKCKIEEIEKYKLIDYNKNNTINIIMHALQNKCTYKFIKFLISSGLNIKLLGLT